MSENTNSYIQKNIEKTSTEIFFRTSTRTKAIYKSLTPEKKRIVKKVLEATIYALGGNKEELNKITRELGIEIAKEEGTNTVTFNINISESESRAEVKIDVPKLLTTINELEALLGQIQKYNFRKDLNGYLLPPARMKDLETRITALKELVN
ncbi:hypothetical protein [Sulfolobus spindle-shaped virus]|nr:hypothetical protein [Sulfolobus spindle-shaped virus]